MSSRVLLLHNIGLRGALIAFLHIGRAKQFCRVAAIRSGPGVPIEIQVSHPQCPKTSPASSLTGSSCADELNQTFSDVRMSDMLMSCTILKLN